MSLRLQTSQRPTIAVFNAGQRSFSRIIGAKRNAWYTFVITATVTIAGGTITALLNGGNLAAMFQYIGIDENGYDAALIDTRMARFLSSITAAGLPADVTLPAGATNGTYNLRTTIRLPFAWILAMDAMETAHVERDPSQDTYMFVQPWGTGVATAAGKLATVPGTAAITNLSVKCYQHFDDKAVADMPIFVPRYRMVQQQIAASVTEQPTYIRSAVPLRGLILGQDTQTLGEQTDIITSIAHRDSLRDYIGPQQADFQGLVSQQPQLYGGLVSNRGGPAPLGGNVAADLTSPYLYTNYQEFGKLSNVWNPATGGVDLRYEITGQPSVVVGAGTSVVNVAVCELLKIANRTKDASFPY